MGATRFEGRSGRLREGLQPTDRIAGLVREHAGVIQARLDLRTTAFQPGSTMHR